MKKNIAQILRDGVHSFVLFIVKNIQTILLLIGLYVINLAVYLINSVAGLIVTGSFLILIAILINYSDKQGQVRR
jgi:hypothetical protein